MIKNPPANARDIKGVGSIPGSGRSPEEGGAHLLQCSCLENCMDRGTWQAVVHRVELDCKELDTIKRLNREGTGTPLQCSCVENPRDRGAWWAAVYGVARSWTRLTRLSSSSSSKRLNVRAHTELQAPGLWDPAGQGLYLTRLLCWCLVSPVPGTGTVSVG